MKSASVGRIFNVGSIWYFPLLFRFCPDLVTTALTPPRALKPRAFHILILHSGAWKPAPACSIAAVICIRKEPHSAE